jgi:hypothetical protein
MVAYLAIKFVSDNYKSVRDLTFEPHTFSRCLGIFGIAIY